MRRSGPLQPRYVASSTYRIFTCLINIPSSATTISRSTSSPTPPTRPVCTCTISTTAHAIYGRGHLPCSTRSRANGASSHSLLRAPVRAGSQNVHGRGRPQRDLEWRVSSSVRPSALLPPPTRRTSHHRRRTPTRRRLFVLLQGQVRQAVHDVLRLARNHLGATHVRRWRQATEEQNGTPGNEGLC